jgi:integrase
VFPTSILSFNFNSISLDLVYESWQDFRNLCTFSDLDKYKGLNINSCDVFSILAKHCNLKDIRIASMCLICYSGFLRFSELLNLRRSDITFFPTYIKFFWLKVRLMFTWKGEMYLSPKQGYLHVLLACWFRFLNGKNVISDLLKFSNSENRKKPE